MQPEDSTPWAVDESGGGGDATAGAAAQQQAHYHPPPQQHTTIDLTGDDSDGDDGGPAGKRQRVGGNSGGPGNSSSGDGEAWLYEDTPMRLQAVRGLPARNNSGALGFSWHELAGEGPIEEAVVVNFKVDVPYLLQACPALQRARRVLVLHGEEGPMRRAVVEAVGAINAAAAAAGAPRRWSEYFPQVDMWGTHHTKAFFLRYPAGLRVVIHSANLVYCDMQNKTQSAFSQDFPSKDAASPRSSAFEEELRAYFAFGDAARPRAPRQLSADDAALVERLLGDHDFSSARAALVASVPGRHTAASGALYRYGHMRVRALLSAEPMPSAWRALPLVAQFSSIGSLHEKWVRGEFLPSFTAGRYAAQAPAVGSGSGAAAAGAAAAAAGVQPAPGPPLDLDRVYLVWPTIREVAASNEGWDAGGSIPGSSKNVSKPFLQPLWARWGGAPAGRAIAMPHIKTFLRFDPATKQLAWLLQGSHNLSAAAWGRLEKGGTQLHVRSYELGALSLPSLEREYRRHRHCGFCATPTGPAAAAGSSAPVGTLLPATAAAAPQSVSFFAARQAGADDIAAASAAGAAPVLLPVPYTLPPERYVAGDKPWVYDESKEYYEGRRDMFGGTYPPQTSANFLV